MVPYLHVTTRIEGRPYDKLLSEKGGTGFPTLMFLDAEGRQLMKHVGPRTPSGFEDSLEEVEEFLELVAEAEGGDAKAAAEVLIRQLRLEWFELEEARKRVEALEKVSSKQKKELAQLLVDTEVRTLAADAGKDDVKRRAAGERFAAMWLEEKSLPSSEAQLYPFWFIMADYAEHAGDKSLFKKIVREAEDTLKHSKYDKVLEKLEQRLKDFKK